jgi:hypothetical protein
LTPQTFVVLRRPVFGFTTAAIAFVFGLMFFYFDDFLFFSPIFTFFVPPDRLPILAIDLAISFLSGNVIALSVFQLRNIPATSNKRTKVGFVGIFAALIAGACPCYYLVPLLAVAGGTGGILGALGILMYAYQLPIKLLSLGLLVFVSLTLERALTAACEVPAK